MMLLRYLHWRIFAGDVYEAGKEQQRLNDAPDGPRNGRVELKLSASLQLYLLHVVT